MGLFHRIMGRPSPHGEALGRRGLHPAVVPFNQFDQLLVGLLGGDVFLDAVLPDVEVDAARTAADVAEVGVGHLAGAVDDAAHDRDLDPLEVLGLRFDALGGLLQVEERAPAGGAGDELGLADAQAARLQDVEGQARRLAGRRPADLDRVADAVHQKRA